jgi:hypothetical protein
LAEASKLAVRRGPPGGNDATSRTAPGSDGAEGTVLDSDTGEITVCVAASQMPTTITAVAKGAAHRHNRITVQIDEAGLGVDATGSADTVSASTCAQRVHDAACRSISSRIS